ncbi:MAG: DNA recombination protein RmuC [Candidatus Hodarchaeota archaeon]
MEIDILIFLSIIVFLLIITVIIQFLRGHGIKTDEISQLVDDSIYKNVSESEKRLSISIGNIMEHMGEIKGTTEVFGKISNDLKLILSGERKRGRLGEILIENILNDVLPSSCWERQCRLGSGKVDLIIKTRDYIVPIDCKFPLNNYEKMIKEENPENKKSYLKKFVKDVKNRIEETSKFVLPASKTTDYALMYVPAESIFLTIVENEDLINLSIKNKVLICSPVTFYYILHAMNETIKREKLPEKIEALYNEFLKLKDDIIQFLNIFETLGVHISNAFNKYNEAQGNIKKIKGRAETLVLEA